jgi:hypothetical protein
LAGGARGTVAAAYSCGNLLAITRWASSHETAMVIAVYGARALHDWKYRFA